MEVSLKKLECALSTAEVIYLSTSKDDKVSSRPVSPLNIGLHLYVRTSAATRKAKEMVYNPNIAVCMGNFYFTGQARLLGSAFDDRNAEIKSAYILRYPDSFSGEDEFIQSDEVFFELSIENVFEWIYEDNIPVGKEGECKMSYYFLADTYIPEDGSGEYEDYIAQVKPIVEQYGGKYLVRTNTVVSLNAGRCPQRSIVIEFPDKEALEYCFSSAEYKAIMMKRVNSVDSRAIIVPGIEEEME